MSDPMSGLAAAFGEAAGASTSVTDHEAAADPHVGYQKEVERNAASGYAGLNADSRMTKGIDATDDLIVNATTRGLVLRDNAGPPAHYWRITIDNTGTLISTDLGTTKP
jgi:hypothetical protein